MKRLIKKSIPASRLRRKIIADWQPIDVNGPDTVQVITDAMASAAQIQIEYQGSGWRLIQPYGWNTSKDGNILLMCYKDTGEIRSYRLDRIMQVLVDNSLLTNYQDTTQNNDMLEVRDYNNPEDFEIPALPNMDEILEQSENESGQELPFDEGIDYLTNNDIIPENHDETNTIDEQPEENQPEENQPEENQPEESEEPKEDEKNNDLLDELSVNNEEENNEK